MNNGILSKNAQSVQDFLIKNSIEAKILELPTSTHTAQDAAQTIGCSINQIVKSLIFKTKDKAEPILILVSGPNRVSEVKIEKILGEKIIKADADFTKKIIGFPIGGIPPFGHKQIIKTFVDEDLMQCNELWAAAGTPNAVFCIKSNDLLCLTSGIVMSLN